MTDDRWREGASLRPHEGHHQCSRQGAPAAYCRNLADHGRRDTDGVWEIDWPEPAMQRRSVWILCDAHMASLLRLAFQRGWPVTVEVAAGRFVEAMATG